MSESAWLAEHKGAPLRTVGYVWECGDDECGCTQATVVTYHQNKVVPSAVVPVAEWKGEFRADHEPGADSDLAEYRCHLKATDPVREAVIEWQAGVDYTQHSTRNGCSD